MGEEYRLWCARVSHTQFFIFITVVPTVVLLVAQEAGVDTEAICTAEFGWHLTSDVHCSNRII